MPLTVPDQTIAAQTKTPDMMNTLGSIMNIKNAQQQLKNSSLAYDVNSAKFAKQTQLRDLAASPEVQNPDGSVDPAKYNAAAFKIDPEQGAATSQGYLSNQNAQISNKTNQFALDAKQQDYAMQQLAPLVNDPNVIAAANPDQMKDPETAAKVRIGLRNAFTTAAGNMIEGGLPASAVEARVKPMMDAIEKNPGVFRQNLTNMMKQRLDAGGQVSAITPSYVSNGQQQINVNPLAAGASPIQSQLPPTTPTFNKETGEPGYVGPQGNDAQTNPNAQGLDLSKLTPMQQAFLAKKDPQAFANGAQDFQQTNKATAKPGFIPSSPPLGATQGVIGTQDAINKHWSDTIDSAKTAQQDIGVLQNIKQHAPGAATGVAADKQSLAQGIAGLLGMDSGELAKTNTDLLAKNSNMLALAGGDTNLARTMAEAATPNNHMTKEAIIQAANQVIAQRKLSLARAQFMTPFKAMADQGHPEMYNNALNQFNSVADPRVIQFGEMTPQERSEMKSSMNPQERTEFGAKLAKARQLGIAQ